VPGAFRVTSAALIANTHGPPRRHLLLKSNPSVAKRCKTLEHQIAATPNYSNLNQPGPSRSSSCIGMDFEVDGSMMRFGWRDRALRVAEPPDDEPDESPDESPETPTDEPIPPRVQDPPPQPDSQGPYVVAAHVP